MREYDKYNGLVVAYDFDNTVNDYHNAGDNYVEVIELIREAKVMGCYLIVFTAEVNTKKVKKFLKENNIPFDAINKNPPFRESKARKIYYNVLLDDRAGLRSAYEQLKAVFDRVKERKEAEEAKKKK